MCKICVKLLFILFLTVTRTHCVETSLLNDNKTSQLGQRQLLFVQDKQQKLQKLFIFKMNNNGATPRIEKTDTVPVGVVEEVLNNNVNVLVGPT